MMRIGILTSGGDSPGMNAAIRAAVRCATAHGQEMVGIRHGYLGLINGDMIPLDNRAVGGIIERGGTFLGSARSKEFMEPDGQQRALRSIEVAGLDGLIVIGGNGSLAGARWLQENGVPTVGIPASIDNDVYGSAMAIGVDTALNTVVECLDRIRDTAISHDRAFVVEVMGRESGYIALMGGLAGGAELVLVPEFPVSLEQISEHVLAGLRKGKHHSIIVVAEGFVAAGSPRADKASGRILSDFLERTGTIETRLSILGHLQRGGSPSAFDRILASRLGNAAVHMLTDGESGVMVALSGQEVTTVLLSEIALPAKNFNPEIYDLVYEIAN
ncbi:MAG TPA: 6-phosphofructokinase [Candidatus Acetothermia bacterium]|nr:6-phosphofructokinase [Candidatus Acetothermia bacterium]